MCELEDCVSCRMIARQRIAEQQKQIIHNKAIKDMQRLLERPPTDDD